MWQIALQVVAEMQIDQRAAWIQNLMIFSIIWSIGGITDAAGRTTFDQTLRQVLSGGIPDNLIEYVTSDPVKLIQKLPEARSVYEYYFNKDLNKWDVWLDATSLEPLNTDARFSELVVPTTDSIRCSQSSLELNLTHCLAFAAHKLSRIQ
jgi:dynein heavy chain, axonemal